MCTPVCILCKRTLYTPLVCMRTLGVYILCITHAKQEYTHGYTQYIYKWKNHFYEMKGDVGMSVHEKERKQEDAYTKTQTHS